MAVSVSATGTAGAAVTLTLPAPSSQQFHRVLALEIVAFTTAARVGSATPVVVSTTGLVGTPSFTMSSAGAVGSREVQSLNLSPAWLESAYGTAVTIVCPATTSVIWRVNINYETA